MLSQSFANIWVSVGIDSGSAFVSSDSPPVAVLALPYRALNSSKDCIDSWPGCQIFV